MNWIDWSNPQATSTSTEQSVTTLSEEEAILALVETLDTNAQDTWERMKRRGLVIGRKG